MPEISVILPVFDRLDLLEAAVRSCELQSFRDFEVIVVDDGSTEDVAGFLNTLDPDLDLRTFHQENAGACRARNHGLSEARGRYINFLDSDDVADPCKLQRLHDGFRDAPEADVIYGLCECFRCRPGDLSILWNQPDERDSINRFLRDDGIWDTCSCLWRQEALVKVGGWSEDLRCWQDWELHLRALARGVVFHPILDVVQYCREHEGPRISSDQGRVRKNLASRVDAFACVARELQRNKQMTAERERDLAQLFVLAAVEATVYRDLASARHICSRAVSCLSEREIRRKFRKVARSLFFWKLGLTRSPNPFRSACGRMGWRTENNFPDSTWQKLPVSPHSYDPALLALFDHHLPEVPA